MRYKNFSADKTGLCVSTLHPNPPAFTVDDVDRLIRVAGEAGFPSIALQSYWITRYGVDRMRGLLNQTGVAAGALEGAIQWPKGADAGVQDADLLLDMTAAIGAGVLHGACMETKLESLAQAVDGLAALCERARPYNIKVSIEPIPFSAVPDLETGWRLVREVGAANCGLCIDFMHLDCEPNGANLDLLRKIPGQSIFYVQLTDSPPTKADSAQSYLAECMVERLPMGEGAIDIDAMMKALVETGTDPYVAFQVCSPKMANEGADVMAGKLRANASAIFD